MENAGTIQSWEGGSWSQWCGGKGLLGQMLLIQLLCLDSRFWSLRLCCVWSLHAARALWAVTGLTGCLHRRGLQRTQRYERCGSSKSQRTSKEQGNANTLGRRRRKWLRYPQHDDAPVPDPQLASPCSHGGVGEWEMPVWLGTHCGLCHFSVSAVGSRDALPGDVPAGWEGWAAIALR